MRALLVVLIVVVAAMAGCAAKKDGDGDADASGTATATKSSTGTKATSSTKSGTGASSATGTPSGGPKSATLSADVHNGTAPLAVNFTVNATAGSTSWRLSFGDGSVKNGTSLPIVANHTYVVGGDFSANLTVTYPGGVLANADTNITVQVPTNGTSAGAPDVTHFELGESLGCAPDGTAVPGVPFYCASFVGGPDASGIDGHWIAVDERYWGMHLTSVTKQSPAGPVPIPVLGGNVGADSDCQFVKADEETLIGDASNGSDSCDGTVPADTAFVFIYPYGAPATSIVVDFVTA